MSQEQLKAGKYFPIVNGSAEEVARAHNILQVSGVEELTHHAEASA